MRCMEGGHHFWPLCAASSYNHCETSHGRGANLEYKDDYMPSFEEYSTLDGDANSQIQWYFHIHLVCLLSSSRLSLGFHHFRSWHCKQAHEARRCIDSDNHQTSQVSTTWVEHLHSCTEALQVLFRSCERGGGAKHAMKVFGMKMIIAFDLGLKLQGLPVEVVCWRKNSFD